LLAVIISYLVEIQVSQKYCDMDGRAGTQATWVVPRTN